MLNLSQLARECHEYPILRRIRSLRDPDIYLAENLVDYQESAKSLEFPWYKRLPFPDKSMDRAYIIFQNIGLKKLVREKMEIPNWFVLYDDSGKELVYWDADHELFPTIISSDKVQAERELKDDWVYDVFVRFLIPSSLPSIVDVSAYRFSNTKPKKESLAERIRNFFPEFESEWQPVF